MDKREKEEGERRENLSNYIAGLCNRTNATLEHVLMFDVLRMPDPAARPGS